MRIISHLAPRTWTRGLSCFALCVATSLAQTSPPATQVSAGTVFPAASSVSAPNTSPAPLSSGDSTIRLGVGDLVELTVYNVPEMQTKTRVSNVGDIYLPFIDYVHVDRLTVDEAESGI